MKAMLLTAAVAVGLGLFLQSSVAEEKKGGGDPKLDGSWKAVALEQFGKPAPKEVVERGLVLTFKGDKVTNKEGGKEEEGAVKLDTSKTPHHIDLIPNKGTPKVLKGIYEIKGDTLKICFGLTPPTKGGEPVSNRPTEFDSKAGLLGTFKRQ